MSGILFPKGRSTTDTRINALELNQSAYGGPIALTYGKTRVPMTLGWYGDFTPIPHTEKVGGKGGGKSTHTSYSYTAAAVMFLGEGEVFGVGTVWSDKEQTTLAALGLTLFTGAGAQAVWSHLTTNHPTEAIGYDHIAYVANAALQLGNSAALPNLSFELKGLCPIDAGTTDDAEASAILLDYCTDPNHGAGFNYLDPTINAAGTASYKAYCMAMGFFLSPSERSQRAASEFIAEILKVTNSECVWSAGVLKVTPLADVSVSGNGRTYTPDLTPVYSFTDDDYLHEEGEDPVKVTRKPPAERFNIVRVEYLNRANQYNVDVAEAKDENDIILNGERPAPTIKLHCIQVTALARQVAQLILQRQLFVVNTYSFRVRPDYSLLEPLDYVAITDSVLGLTNKLVRLTETEDSEEDEFSITAEEVLVGTASAPLYNWQASAGFAANYSAAPGAIATPLIFNIPAALVSVNGGYELGIAVSGPGALWGGCDVYMSLDNLSYQYVGSIYGSARYGTLTASLASAADPDTTNTLAVQLADTKRDLVSGSATDAADNRTLLYVDGEIMAYQTATLTGPGAYNLTTLRRARYGSVQAGHASGTKFARIDASIFRMPYDPGMIGRTAYFKFLSFNAYGGGLEDISGATVYSKVLAAENAGQLVPGALTLVGRGVTVSGDRVFKSANTAAWDSDCFSQQGYTGGAFVSWRPVETSTSFMIGLNADPGTDSSFPSIDYAMFCGGGNLYVYESGVGTGILGSYAAGDDLCITYDNAIVRYLKAGLVLREVMAGPDKRFCLDSSLHTPGAGIADIRFGPYGAAAPVLYNARGNCVVSDTNAQKVGGTGAWDSDIYSLKGYPTCHVSFKANRTDADIIIGLNTDPLTDQSYGSIDFSLYISSAGALGYRESAGGADPWTYNTSSVMAITYDGTDVRYYKDGVLLRTVNAPGLTLYLDSSFLTPGGGINSLRFGPTANLAVIDTAQIADEAAFKSYLASGAGGSAPGVRAFPTTVASITVPALDFDATVVVTFVSNISITTGAAGGRGGWAYIATAVDGSYDDSDVNARVIEWMPSSTASNPVSIEETFNQPAGAAVTYNVYCFRSPSGTAPSPSVAAWKLKAEAMLK